MIWTSLAEQAVYPQDREQCFRWFAEVKRMNFRVFFSGSMFMLFV